MDDIQTPSCHVKMQEKAWVPLHTHDDAPGCKTEQAARGQTADAPEPRTVTSKQRTPTPPSRVSST